jgi:AcrR family transcriptional regulator
MDLPDSGAVGSQPSRGSRRERERAFRTLLILEAAEKVFVEHGFQAASVEEIAAASEVAIATLYKTFGSKEAVFAALVDHRQAEFMRELERSVADAATPQSQVERLVETIFAHFERHQAAFRIYLGATHGFPWHIRSSLGERSFANYRRLVDFVSDLLRAGMKAGVWSNEDPDAIAEAMVGVLNGLLTHRHVSEVRTSLEAETWRATDLLLRLLRPPLATAPSKRNRKTGTQ